MTTTPTYRPGDIVRYAEPQPDEASLTFTVVEDNGDRVLMESRDFPDWRVKPREVVSKADIAPARLPLSDGNC
jgi:hypothetical protein